MGDRVVRRPGSVRETTWQEMTASERATVATAIARVEDLESLLEVAQAEIRTLSERIERRGGRIEALHLRALTAEATVEAQARRLDAMDAQIGKLRGVLERPPPGPPPLSDDLRRSALPIQLPVGVDQALDNLENTVTGVDAVVPLQEAPAGHVAWTPSLERRRSAWRVTLMAVATITTSTDTISGVSENLALGGVFVRTMRPPPLGTQVRVELRLPDREPVVADGAVRWHRRNDEGVVRGCGVVFSELAPEAAQHIERIVDILRLEPPDLTEDNLVTL